MKTYNVGIIGATGMVGQRFAALLEEPPLVQRKGALPHLPVPQERLIKRLSAQDGSSKSLCPRLWKTLLLWDATADIEKIASQVDFVFCAVDMKKDEIKALEEAYAKHECPVMSNNSANRFTPDVPMIIPEINAEHMAIVEAQKKRLGTKRGFISVKSNCSIQSYVPALHPLTQVRHHKGSRLHISGNFRCRQNIRNMA